MLDSKKDSEKKKKDSNVDGDDHDQIVNELKEKLEAAKKGDSYKATTFLSHTLPTIDATDSLLLTRPTVMFQTKLNRAQLGLT